MVNAQSYSYNVYLISKASQYKTQTEITDGVLAIPLFTDTGLDEVNAAQLQLNSPFGEFLTKEPIIRDNDHVRIVATDGAGNVYDREFEHAPTERAMEITEGSGTGKTITLHLEGIEYHTNRIHYIKPIFRESGYEVALDIGNNYNANRGSLQPKLFNHHNNELPKHILHNFPYGDSLASTRDRWTDLVTSFGAPGEAGGVLDFFTLGFNTGGNSPNIIILDMHSLGSTPTNPITITEGVLTTGEDDRQTTFAPPEATRIIGLFGNRAGSLPTDFSKFSGQEFSHLFRSVHNPTIAYITGEQVRDPADTNRLYPIYQAKQNVPAGTSIYSTSHWQRISYQAFVGKFQYSPWTDDKATLWASSGTDPTSLTRWGRAMPDFNATIKTNDFFRVITDYVANSPTQVPAQLLQGGNFYRGFRVLIRNGTGTYAGLQNVIIQYETPTTWKIQYTFGSNNSGAYVIDECTGDGWIFNGSTFSKDTDARSRDCLHPYESIQNVQGYRDTTGQPTNQDSAVEITYDVGGGSLLPLAVAELAGLSADSILTFLADPGLAIHTYFVNLFFESTPEPEEDETAVTTGQLYNFPISRQFYAAGATLRFKLPFPSNKFGGITEEIGALYGGTSATKGEPATLDLQNNHLTHDGQRGFNNSSSDDLGRGQGIGFYIKLKLTDRVTDNIETSANYPVRVFMRDTDDHVWFSDITVPFNDVWSPQIIPFNSFAPYRPIKPKEVLDIIVPPAEIEQENDFRPQNVKEIGWTLLSAYDDQGRFDTIKSSFDSITEAAGDLPAGLVGKGRLVEDVFSVLAGKRIRMAIDAFRIVKQLVVVSEPSTTINQESRLDLPDIIDYNNATNFIKSKEEQLKFPKKNIILNTKGRFDVGYGDSIFYKNPKVITDSDNGSNTIKLAVQRIEHSIVGGEGFRTVIYGNKRFT